MPSYEPAGTFIVTVLFMLPVWNGTVRLKSDPIVAVPPVRETSIVAGAATVPLNLTAGPFG